MKTLDEIFKHTLKDIYYAETALTKALPKMVSAAGNAELKAAFAHHLEETRGQIKMLDKVFASVGEKAAGEKCDAIEGLIKEADGLMKDASGVALDAALIGAAQAVEHYEIPAMAPCANGPAHSVMPRHMICCRRFWIRKRPQMRL